MNDIKIIIVEDELIAAEFLKDIVESTGAEVIDIIDNGKEAIESCIDKKPDVIFMDIMLSDNISGSEAALAISKSSPHSKIIFLSAYVEDEMLDYAAASNAVSYLTKPYNEAQIITTLKLACMKKDKIEPEQKEVLADKVYLKNGFVYLREQNRLLKNEKEVELGATTLKLIKLLCKHPGISVSNEQISMYIWDKSVNDKTLRSLMFRVRSATDDELIKNISGTGYMIQVENR